MEDKDWELQCTCKLRWRLSLVLPIQNINLQNCEYKQFKSQCKTIIIYIGNSFCSPQELIEKLLSDILLYYVNMGACQFLRDFRRECQVKKSVELRKRVLQRQEKKKEKSDSVPFQVFLLLSLF